MHWHRIDPKHFLLLLVVSWLPIGLIVLLPNNWGWVVLKLLCGLVVGFFTLIMFADATGSPPSSRLVHSSGFLFGLLCFAWPSFWLVTPLALWIGTMMGLALWVDYHELTKLPRPNFLKPRWQQSSPRSREKGVAKLENQSQLMNIASRDPAAHVRRAAVEKLKSTSDLEGITRKERDPTVRELALSRLNDMRPKWQHSDPMVREKAIATVKDLDYLAIIAHTDSEHSLRVIAARAAIEVIINHLEMGSSPLEAMHMLRKIAVAELIQTENVSGGFVMRRNDEVADCMKDSRVTGMIEQLLGLLGDAATAARHRSVRHQVRKALSELCTIGLDASALMERLDAQAAHTQTPAERYMARITKAMEEATRGGGDIQMPSTGRVTSFCYGNAAAAREAFAGMVVYAEENPVGAPEWIALAQSTRQVNFPHWVSFPGTETGSWTGACHRKLSSLGVTIQAGDTGVLDFQSYCSQGRLLALRRIR